MSRIPKHGLRNFRGTGREYKREFRARLRAIRRAVDSYRICCAYTPREAYSALLRIELDLRIMEKAMSAKEWGR